MSNKKGHKLPKLTLHPLFIILGVIFVVLGEYSSFFICTISACVHELGHMIIASKYGYEMTRIRLMPFGAELHGDTDSFDGRDEIYIALAGPCVNFFICLIILGFWWISPRIYGFTHQIFQTNLVMGVFNMLPLFPLDGGRILLSVLSQKMPRRTGVKVVKRISKTSAILLFVIFIFSMPVQFNLSLGIMSFVLFFSASNSARDAVYQKISLVQLVQKRCVEWVIISVPEDIFLYQLRHYYIKNKVVKFIVLNGCGEASFSFSQLDLERILWREKQSMKVCELKDLIDKKIMI